MKELMKFLSNGTNMGYGKTRSEVLKIEVNTSFLFILLLLKPKPKPVSKSACILTSREFLALLEDNETSM